MAVLSFMLVGCAAEDATERTASFEQVATIGLDEPEDANGGPLFGSIMDLAVDNDEHLYILDSQYHRIRVYTPSGELTRTIQLQQGSGPGEVQRATRLSVAPDGTMYLVDFLARKVMKFDPQGNFLIDIPAPGMTTQVLANSDRVFLTRLWMTSGDDLIYAHNSDGELLSQFLSKPEGADLIGRSGNFGRMASTSSNTLLYSFPFPYRIVEIDGGGNVVREANGHTPFDRAPVSVENGMVNMPQRSNGLVVADDDLVINVAMYDEVVYFDLFDGDLSFIERLDSTQTGLTAARNMRSDGNGHLYFSKDAPVPHVINVRIQM